MLLIIYIHILQQYPCYTHQATLIPDLQMYREEYWRSLPDSSLKSRGHKVQAGVPAYILVQEVKELFSTICRRTFSSIPIGIFGFYPYVCNPTVLRRHVVKMETRMLLSEPLSCKTGFMPFIPLQF